MNSFNEQQNICRSLQVAFRVRNIRVQGASFKKSVRTRGNTNKKAVADTTRIGPANTGSPIATAMGWITGRVYNQRRFLTSVFYEKPYLIQPLVLITVFNRFTLYGSWKGVFNSSLRRDIRCTIRLLVRPSEKAYLTYVSLRDLLYTEGYIPPRNSLNI